MMSDSNSIQFVLSRIIKCDRSIIKYYFPNQSTNNLEPNLQPMLKGLKIYQYLTLVIVLFTTINSLAFIAVGVIESFHGFKGILTGKMHTDERPGLMILESLDMFLIALVFIVFSIGIIMLFLPNTGDKIRGHVPKWMNIHTFMELKLILWEAILTALIVFFVGDVVKQADEGHFRWEMLLIPCAILILSISIFVLRKSEHK
jgi:uncharacterized membrane protein YqhA